MNTTHIASWLATEPFVERIGWLLVHSLWQFTLIAAATAGLLGVLRRRSASARYATLAAAMTLLAVLPPINAYVTRDGSTASAAVDSRSPVADAALTPAEPRTPSVRRESGRATAGDGELADEARPALDVANDAAPALEANAVATALSPDATREAASARSLAWYEQTQALLRPWLRWIVATWAIGVLFWSLRPLLGWHMLWRLKRVGVRPATDEVLATARRVATRLGLARTVRVLESTLAQVPLVIGYFRPVVLLPASLFTSIPVGQLEAILAHELAHVRRHDFLVNLLQTLVETLFFYHPATWWLSRRMRIEREHCCDDLVVERLGNRAEYGRALLAVEELRGTGTVLALGVNDGSLLSRIRRIAGVEAEASSGRWRATWLAGASLVCAGATLTSLFAQSAPLEPAAPRNAVSAATVATGPSGDAPTKTPPAATRPGAESSELPAKPREPLFVDWPLWGGSPRRNHVSSGRLPTDWSVKGDKNIAWRREVGTQTYSSPVVAGGKIFIGTNNEAGLDPRRPKDKDLSCLVCLDQATGELSWIYASEKLAAGRPHDWPSIGLCSTACVQGDRLWVVTNRCEVVCLDVNGFRDGENDGEFSGETERTERDADVVWKFDMFQTLGVRPLHQAVSSIAVVDGIVLLNTSNGPDESRGVVPAPHAPNFLALDAVTGRVVWQDNSAGDSIIVGGSACGCSGTSPAVGTIGGVTQAIFAGREGWLHGYDFADLKRGKTTKLWQFDCNPKAGRYFVGQQSQRNTLVASPVIVGDRVFIATGRNPEEGEGPADLWCVDATKRGDISSELVFNPAHREGKEPIPFKTLCACDSKVGDFVRPNPNSGAVWRYVGTDHDRNEKLSVIEAFHRSTGSPVVHNGLVFIADFAGILHCVDALTGQGQWTLDLFAATWGSCVVAGDKVLIADEDGDLAIVRAARKLELIGDEGARNLGHSVYGTPTLVGDTLFVPTKNAVVAIRAPESKTDTKPADRKVPLAADGLPLRTALEQLAAQARLKMDFDAPALAAAGLDLERPITQKFDDLPLDRALTRLIPWLRYGGVYREFRDDTLVLTTISATAKRTIARLPVWLKPLYGEGLLATVDENGQIVSITSSRIVTDELLEKFATLPRLRELAIEGTDKLSPAGLAYLGKMRSLAKLSLSGIRFEGRGLGDDALRSVAGLSSLQSLAIRECGTTDAGARLLEKMPQLTDLSLGTEGTLSDEALRSVGALKNLKSLALASYVATEQYGRMRFSADGVRRLSGLKLLESLQLVGHEISADALDFPRLTSLSLGDGSVDDQVAAKIAELRELRELELSYCSFGDVGLARLADLPELRRLDISSVKITDTGVEHLRGHRRLAHVSLRASQLTDASLRHLAQIATLTRVDLSSTSRPGDVSESLFSIAGIQELKRLPKLETLYLAGLDLTGIAGLKELRQLRELSLMMCHVTESELDALDAALPDTSISHATGGGSWLPKRFRTPNVFLPAQNAQP